MSLAGSKFISSVPKVTAPFLVNNHGSIQGRMGGSCHLISQKMGWKVGFNTWQLDISFISEISMWKKLRKTPNAPTWPKFLQDHWEVCATGRGAIDTQAETQLLHAGGKSEVMNFLSNKKWSSHWVVGGCCWMWIIGEIEDLAADKQKEITW